MGDARPKRGAEGTVSPEGEGNPAEGGSLRVYDRMKVRLISNCVLYFETPGII